MNKVLVFGIGGRGCLIAELLTAHLPGRFRMLCVDSDPALQSARLEGNAKRILLDPKRSPNRSIEYAREIFNNERERIERAIGDFIAEATVGDAAPLLLALCSSPRGGISNAFTFEIARLLRRGPLFNATVQVVAVGVVPTFNNAYRDVITVNAGQYFREMAKACSERSINAVILVNEDYLKIPDDKPREQLNHLRFCEGLSVAFDWMLGAEGRRSAHGLCTIAMGDWRPAASPGEMEVATWRPFFGSGVGNAAARSLLALPPSGEISAALRQSFTVAQAAQPANAQAVAFLRFDEHPDVRRFLDAKEVSAMRCWKIGDGICTQRVAYNSRKVFVGMPFHKRYDDTLQGIERAATGNNLEVWRADQETSNVDIMCKVCKNMQEAEFAVIDVTELRPNVMFELGLLYGRGKRVVLLQRSGQKTPTDLKGIEMIPYDNSSEVEQGLKGYFKGAKK